MPLPFAATLVQALPLLRKHGNLCLFVAMCSVAMPFLSMSAIFNASASRCLATLCRCISFLCNSFARRFVASRSRCYAKLLFHHYADAVPVGAFHCFSMAKLSQAMPSRFIVSQFIALAYRFESMHFQCRAMIGHAMPLHFTEFQVIASATQITAKLFSRFENQSNSPLSNASAKHTFLFRRIYVVCYSVAVRRKSARGYSMPSPVSSAPRFPMPMPHCAIQFHSTDALCPAVAQLR